MNRTIYGGRSLLLQMSIYGRGPKTFAPYEPHLTLSYGWDHVKKLRKCVLNVERKQIMNLQTLWIHISMLNLTLVIYF